MNFIFILLLVLKLADSIFDPINEIDLIVDVAKSFEKPTSIAACVCWTREQTARFAARLKISDNTKRIAFAKKILRDSPRSILNVVDLRCPNGKDILIKSQNENMLRDPYRWLIVGIFEDNNNLTIPSVLEDLVILTDSDVMVAINKADGRFEIMLVYKIHQNYSWITENFGNWDVSEGLHVSEEMIVSKPVRRKNLMGHSIKTSIIILNNRTKSDLRDLSRLQEDFVTKCSFRIASPMYDYMNATRVNVYTDTWGYFINGSWNGMMGDIVYNKAEFTGTVSFMSIPRLDKVQYLITAVQTTAQFVFREPSLSSQNNLYLLPFKGTVWLCIAAFVVIMVVVLYFNAKWAEKRASDDNTTTKLSDIIMLVVSAMSLQGNSGQMEGLTGRLVIFILFLAFLFLHTSYSASVVALLQSTSNDIRSLADLLNSKLELGVEDTPYNKHYFPNADDPLRKAIYSMKVAPKGSAPHYMSIENGVRKMQKSAFAFHMNTGIGYWDVQKYFYEHEKCGLREINYYPSTLVPWLACKKNSPYKEFFLIGLIRIWEHGMKDREHRLMLARKPICTARGGSVVSVSILEVYPALLMLLYGALLAVGILAAEILIHRLNRRKQLLYPEGRDIMSCMKIRKRRRTIL